MNSNNKYNQKIRKKRRNKRRTRRINEASSDKKCNGLPIIQEGDYMIGGGDDAHAGVFQSIKDFLIRIKNFFSKILYDSYNTVKEFFSTLKELTVLLLKTFIVVDYDMLFPIRTVYSEYQKNIIEIMKYFYARACSPPYVRFSQLFSLFAILKQYRDESGWKEDANEFEIVDPVNPSNPVEFTSIYHKKHISKNRSDLFSTLTKELIYNPLKLDIVQDIIEGVESGMSSIKENTQGIINAFKKAFTFFIEFCSTIYEYLKTAGSGIKNTFRSVFYSKKGGSKPRFMKRKLRGGLKWKHKGGRLFQDLTESLKQKSLMAANKLNAASEYVTGLVMSDRARKQARLRYFIDRYVAIGNDYIKGKKANFLASIIIQLYLLKEGIGASDINNEAKTKIKAFFDAMPYCQDPEFKINIELLIKLHNLRIKNDNYYEELAEVLGLDKHDLPSSKDTEDKQKFNNYLIKKIKATIEQNIIDNITRIGRDCTIKIKKGYTIDVEFNGKWRPAIVDQVVKNKKEKEEKEDTYTFTVKIKDGNDTLVMFNTREPGTEQRIMEHFDRFVPGGDTDPTETVTATANVEPPTLGGGIRDFFTKAFYVKKYNESYKDRYPMILPITDSNKVAQFKETTIVQIHRIVDGFGIKRANVIRLNGIERVSYKIEELDFYNKILKDCIDDLILSSDVRFQPILRKIALDNIIYANNSETETDSFSGFKQKVLGVPISMDGKDPRNLGDGIIGKINEYYRKKISDELDYYDAREKISSKSEEEWKKEKMGLKEDIQIEWQTLVDFLININHKRCIEVLFSKADMLYSMASFRNKTQSFMNVEQYSDNSTIEQSEILGGGGGEDDKFLFSAITNYHEEKIMEQTKRIEEERRKSRLEEEKARLEEEKARVVEQEKARVEEEQARVVEEQARLEQEKAGAEQEKAGAEEGVLQENQKSSIPQSVIEEPSESPIVTPEVSKAVSESPIQPVIVKEEISKEEEPEKLTQLSTNCHRILLKLLNEEINEELYKPDGSYKNQYGPNVSNRLYNEATSRTLFTQFLQEDVKSRVKVYIQNCSMKEINELIESDNINKRNKILFEHIIDIWDMYQLAKPYKSFRGPTGSINGNIKKAILTSLDEKFKDTFRELLLSGTDDEYATVLSSISQIMVVSPLLAICMTMATDVFSGRFSPGCVLSALSAIHFLFSITCTSSVVPPDMQSTIQEFNKGLENKNKEVAEETKAIDEKQENKQDTDIETANDKAK